ncbi:MAG: SbcC/MukB-like Walker B domain-containing protein, partial [Lachnospirales bacterium]
NTVEGYLNTQRFFLIVEPKYYDDAYYAYKNFRKNNPEIYRYKIVDCQKVYDRSIIPVENSLAKTIITDNKYAKAYINYVLGNVIMCKNDKDLRKYNTAVTIDGMLYKGYTSGTMNHKLWEIHYIGKSSIQQQIAFNENKLGIFTTKSEVLNNVANNMRNMMENRFMNKQYIEGDITKIYINIDVTEKENKKLEIFLKELNSIDLSTIQNIQKDIGIWEENIKELNSEKDKLNQRLGSKESEIKRIKSEIPIISGDINQLRDKLCDYKDEIAEKGKLISDEAIEKCKDVNNAIQYCNKCSNDYKGKSGELHNETYKLKCEYCNEFTPLTILDNDNTAFIKEYERKININLPAYKEKIKEAKEESYRQFQSSFLDKLRENIINAQFQLKEINRALKSFEFGNDKYKFDVQPKSEYMKYYEMIMEERTGGDLFEMMFLNKYEDVLNDLFEKIVGTDTNSYNDKKFEENIKKFTDYKTYLDFKMYVTDNNGRTENLADTIKSKSGGETQTPFYVSFLASFAQMYKSNLYGESLYKINTARFIIFDEAFNNMDTVRIEESINLLRELNLQAIICAPTNKASEIMLKVDKTLMVYRKDDNVRVIPWTRGSENFEIY